jgi:glycerol-3-phosphate dehydrogenase
VLKSAKELGLTAYSFANFINAKKLTNGHQISYEIENKKTQVHSKMIINAAGPWVNQVLNNISPDLNQCKIDWVQGTHIILDKTAPKKVFYLESKTDKRVIFVMPWYGKTLIGTTEVLLKELSKKIKPTKNEINYLLDIYQHYYPGNLPKIIRSFAGVRVLPKLKNAAFSRPRESIIWQDIAIPSIISLYGGKLTTFRTTAKKVVKLIKKQLGPKENIADIDHLPLYTDTQFIELNNKKSISD